MLRHLVQCEGDDRYYFALPIHFTITNTNAIVISLKEEFEPSGGFQTCSLHSPRINVAAAQSTDVEASTSEKFNS